MQTQHKNITITVGALRDCMVAKINLDSLRILGFIPTNKSMPFKSIIPIKILSESSFLKTLAVSMIQNELDAVAFAEKDYIIRALHVESKILMMLCIPKKPLFESNSHVLNYPDFSLILNQKYRSQKNLD